MANDLGALGSRLRKARQDAALTQKQAASAGGVTSQAISDYERGLYPPREEVLERLALAYGTTVAALRYGGEVDRRTIERPMPRVVQSHAVRVWLKQFELELVRAGVPDERIAEAVDLVTAPTVFRYFAGGAVREMDEERAIRAMETLAQIIRRRAREEGYNVEAP